MTSPRPRGAPAWRGTAIRTVAVAGLVVSIALALDYLAAEPSICGSDGCASVRESAWARPLGIPLPAVGLLYFAVVLGLSSVRLARRRWLPWLVGAGGAVAAGLLVVQGAVLGTWCKLCVATDVSALVLAALILVPRHRDWPVPSRRETRLLAALAVIAVGGLVAIAALREPPGPPAVPPGATLPAVVAGEQRPGELTIVDFVDFECPHCRRFDETLTAALDAVDAPVRVARKMVPLRHLHPHAESAARAWVCVDAQGRGDAMATALFRAPVDDLSTEGAERLASGQDIDMDAYRTCIGAATTDQRIERDRADAMAVGVSSLPVVYIGSQVFMGSAATQPDVEAALRRELAAVAGRRAAR